jgi:hypothetical protein
LRAVVCVSNKSNGSLGEAVRGDWVRDDWPLGDWVLGEVEVEDEVEVPMVPIVPTVPIVPIVPMVPIVPDVDTDTPRADIGVGVGV